MPPASAVAPAASTASDAVVQLAPIRRDFSQTATSARSATQRCW